MWCSMRSPPKRSRWAFHAWRSSADSSKSANATFIRTARIPLWPLRRNASFHVVAMDAVFAGDQEQTRKMLEEISGLVEIGVLCPLPFRSFPACRIDSAFRLMAQGKHIGKVVVAFPRHFFPGGANRSGRSSRSRRMDAT